MDVTSVTSRSLRFFFAFEGSSTKIMPKKIQRQPSTVGIESCSFATRTPVNAAKTGSIAKIMATLVGEVCFCAAV